MASYLPPTPRGQAWESQVQRAEYRAPLSFPPISSGSQRNYGAGGSGGYSGAPEFNTPTLNHITGYIQANLGNLLLYSGLGRKVDKDISHLEDTIKNPDGDTESAPGPVGRVTPSQSRVAKRSSPKNQFDPTLSPARNDMIRNGLDTTTPSRIRGLQGVPELATADDLTDLKLGRVMGEASQMSTVRGTAHVIRNMAGDVGRLGRDIAAEALGGTRLGHILGRNQKRVNAPAPGGLKNPWEE